MTSDQESARREPCPFCGKSFKRLKSHLPHCKMAPVARETGGSKSRTEQHSGALPARVEAEKSMMGGPREQLWDTGRVGHTVPPTQKKPRDMRVTSKARSAKVSTDKKTAPKKPPDTPTESSISSRRDNKEAALGAGVLRAAEGAPVQPSQAEMGDTPVSPGPSSTAAGVRASSCESTQTNGPPQSTASIAKGTQTVVLCASSTRGGTVVQSSLRAPVVLDTGAARGKGNTQVGADILQWDSAASQVPGLGSPSEYHQRMQICAKTHVWDHIKGSLTSNVCGHLARANRNRGAPGVWPTPMNPEPPGASVRAVETLFQSGLVEVRDCGGSMSKGVLVPASVDRPLSCPLGLEWMPELAFGYQGIGFSMLPLLSHTEHVQRQPPPVLPVVTEIQGCLAERALMDVTLAELPMWLRLRRPLLTPGGGVASLQRGWQRYYSKYIDVRRGGVGGVAMLLAGYCVLSYMFRYPHLKQECWRKYH